MQATFSPSGTQAGRSFARLPLGSLALLSLVSLAGSAIAADAPPAAPLAPPVSAAPAAPTTPVASPPAPIVAPAPAAPAAVTGAPAAAPAAVATPLPAEVSSPEAAASDAQEAMNEEGDGADEAWVEVQIPFLFTLPPFIADIPPPIFMPEPAYEEAGFAAGENELTFELHFPFNSADFRATPSQERATLMEMLGSGELLSAEVVGHADPRGSAAYNKALSLKRAQGVCRWIAQQTGVRNCRAYGAGTRYQLGDWDLDRRAGISLVFAQ